MRKVIHTSCVEFDEETLALLRHNPIDHAWADIWMDGRECIILIPRYTSERLPNVEADMGWLDDE